MHISINVTPFFFSITYILPLFPYSQKRNHNHLWNDPDISISYPERPVLICIALPWSHCSCPCSCIIPKTFEWSKKKKPYLTSRGKLQGPKGSLKVGRVVLQIVKSTGDGGLQLRRVLPRRRVEGNLVKRSHVGRPFLERVLPFFALLVGFFFFLEVSWEREVNRQ